MPAECKPSVSTIPGLIEFTRIFRGANSPASDTVIASTAALVALYTAAPGTGIGPTTELTLITGPPSGAISLTASCVVRSSPRTLRLNCLWK